MSLSLRQLFPLLTLTFLFLEGELWQAGRRRGLESWSLLVLRRTRSLIFSLLKWKAMAS